MHRVKRVAGGEMIGGVGVGDAGIAIAANVVIVAVEGNDPPVVIAPSGAQSAPNGLSERNEPNGRGLSGKKSLSAAAVKSVRHASNSVPVERAAVQNAPAAAPVVKAGSVHHVKDAVLDATKVAEPLQTKNGAKRPRELGHVVDQNRADQRLQQPRIWMMMNLALGSKIKQAVDRDRRLQRRLGTMIGRTTKMMSSAVSSRAVHVGLTTVMRTMSKRNLAAPDAREPETMMSLDDESGDGDGGRVAVAKRSLVMKRFETTPL